MSIDELLKPRYKVIASYPNSIFKVGDVFTSVSGKIYCDPESVKFSDYPHLFQPLPWWAERKLEEMPQYVKVIHEDIAKDTGRFCKVYKWHEYDDKWPRVKGDLGAEIEGYCPSYLQNKDFNFDGQVYGRVNAGHLLPATEADYTAYITQTQQP